MVRTQPLATHGPPALDLDATLSRVFDRIAPTWPLDRFIAVNPLWGWVEQPLPQVSRRFAASSGVRLCMPRAWYLEAWRRGEIGASHLERALAEAGDVRRVDEVVQALGEDPPSGRVRERVTDLAVPTTPWGITWADYLTQSLGHFCAAWFDRGLALLAPIRRHGMYGAWRRMAVEDRGPRVLMGAPAAAEHIGGLPTEPRALVAEALGALGVPASQAETYLTSLLFDLNGWAAHCAYQRLTTGTDDDLMGLLAIRLAWELVVFRVGGEPLAARWAEAVREWPSIDRHAWSSQSEEWLFQRALELAYQDRTARAIASRRQVRVGVPEVQAVFCIDVRSEVYRRALEAELPTVQTLGFAGFFGVPAEYVGVGLSSARPQLPGPLKPAVRITDTGVEPGTAQRRRRRLGDAAAWKGLSKTGAFAFVEALGPLYAARLATDGWGLTRPAQRIDHAGLSAAERAARRPRITGSLGGDLGPDERAALAVGILRGMSLTRDFAPVVALIGHGSSSVNNPHAAGLDCGACCGQTGEVNARAAAALLNDPAVREAMRARGVVVPHGTWFVAGLHDTTLDEVELFDVDLVPAAHVAAVQALRAAFDRAGDRARAERAPAIGLVGLDAGALRRAVERRSRDWGQVRPEWGLAGNAAFVVAPRARHRHVDFGGRAFLHEYRWQDDPDASVLTQILTAPMVVAHWINLQYYASTVAPRAFGSGNKVLHNVVAGGVGVVEGNGGDLRIGLPLQSVHDGTRFVHTPLRLSVFVEAPEAAIDAVLRAHPRVHDLVENAWLFLFRIDPESGAVRAWREGRWTPFDPTKA